MILNELFSLMNTNVKPNNLERHSVLRNTGDTKVSQVEVRVVI